MTSELPYTLPATLVEFGGHEPVTADLLLYEDPEDVEAVMVAWLTPLRADTAVTYKSGDPLPFTMVRHAGGGESPQEGTADHLVMVHTLCDKTLGQIAARDECRNTHRRILQLARYQDVFTLPGGRGVAVDYITVVESPIWIDFEDNNIWRKVGTYQVGLSYTDSPNP